MRVLLVVGWEQVERLLVAGEGGVEVGEQLGLRSAGGLGVAEPLKGDVGEGAVGGGVTNRVVLGSCS
jgi:hypothetical protein